MPVSEIIKRLNEYEIRPNEQLGQHILIDPKWLGYIADQTCRGGHVIEIGAGPGNLTEPIAALAKYVTAIELDRRYEPMLQDLHERHPNITVIFGDAIKQDFRQIQKQSDKTLQIIGNIPYHISEPLMKKLADAPIEDAVLTVGDKLSETLRETNPSSINFTRLSLLALGFFDVDLLAKIPKNAFFPIPRTESQIIRITPKMKAESSNPSIRVIQQLFLSGDSSSVENIMRTALNSGISDRKLRYKDEQHRYERRETRRSLEMMKRGYNASQDLSEEDGQQGMSKDPLSRMLIPEQILTRRFSSLNNDEVCTLSRAILDVYPNQ